MKWSKNLEDVVGGRLYGHISTAVGEAIESGCTFADFKEILNSVIIEMVELGYMFDDYREFRHEIEAGIDIDHPKEEWEKMLDEAREYNALQAQPLNGDDMICVEQVRASFGPRSLS